MSGDLGGSSEVNVNRLGGQVNAAGQGAPLQGCWGAWLGDAANLPSLGHVSADQMIQLRNATYAPARLIFV